MVERKLYIIYIVIFLATNSSVYSSSLKTTLVNLNKTWSEAAEYCRTQFPNGHLASQSDISLLQNRNNIADSLSIWVADNVVLTPWMKIIGCFEESVITQFILNHLVLDNNRPGLCHLWCTSSFAYFAVKGSSCYCLNDSFVGNATGTDQCDCQTPTYDADINEYCGGTTTVNVYKKDSYDTDERSCNKQAEAGCNCLLAECTAAQQEFNYYNKLCGTSHQAICGNGEVSNGIAGTWSNKISRCRRTTNTYLQTQEDALRSILCRQDITSQYWIGIYRTRTRINFTAYNNDITFTDPVTCGRCVFGNGSCEVIDSPACNVSYQFACTFNELEVTTVNGSIYTTVTDGTTFVGGGEGGISMGVVIGLIIVVLVIIGAVVVLIMIRKHRRKSSSQGHDSVPNTQIHHEPTPPKQMTSAADEEENEYDVTNRTGRKQSESENNYDHMFSTMNDEGMHNSFNRGTKNKTKKISTQGHDSVTNTQNRDQHTPPKQMASDIEEENEYDISNRIGRKQSDSENNYDHMFSTMNEEGMYNSLNRGANSTTDSSNYVYDHAIKPDENYYDAANEQHHVQVVVTAENTYDVTDIG